MDAERFKRSTKSTIPYKLPTWINTELFVDLLKSEIPNFKRIKEFITESVLKPSENYNTILIRIKIQVKVEGFRSKYISFVLKLPQENQFIQQTSSPLKPLQLESRMYNEIIPELEQLYKDAGLDIKFGPRKYQLKTSNPYLLLEDLQSYGFRNNNRSEGLNIKHIHCVLKKLAQFHAATAKLFDNKALNKEDFPINIALNLAQEQHFLECAKSYKGNEEYLENLENLIQNNAEVNVKANQINDEEFKVLNHGHFGCDNIMFQCDTLGNVKDNYFLGYGTPKYGSPVLDLYNFLLTSTKLEVKVVNFEDFVEIYYEELVKNLKMLKYSKQLPSLKELHMALNRHGVWAYITATTAMAQTLNEANDCDDSEPIEAISSEGNHFYDQLYSNQNYRRHIDVVLPWLLNRGALDF